MKVLVDCYELVRGRGLSTGIYNCALHLTRALARLPEARELEWVLACNDLNAAEFRRGGGLPVAVIDGGPRGKPGKVAWDLGRAAWALGPLGADVYFSPRGFAPLGIERCARDVVITVHDMIPFYYSAHCATATAWLENRYVTARLLQSIARADLVLTVSRGSAAEIARLSGRTARVEVIPNGVRASAVQPAPEKTHVFALASGLRHKNLEGVLRGYAAYLRAAGPSALPLVVCGATRAACERWTRDGAVLENVRCLTGVDDAELDRLYASCAAFLFLSRVEGFGLPPLEALQAGARVVASDIPVHREVLGGACRYVDPEDGEAIGRAIAATVAGDQAPRAEIHELLRRYSWDEAARRFVSALRALREGREVARGAAGARGAKASP